MPERPSPKGESYKNIRRAGLLAGGVLAVGATEACLTRETEPEHEVHYRADFNDPEFFVDHPRGEYTPAERHARTKHLAGGEELLYDAGIAFYHVKDGETLLDIRERLGQYPEFSYIKKQRSALQSFNISADDVTPGMWLPLPLENAHRQLTDAEFAAYSDDALEEMADHPKYGKEVRAILQAAGKKELLAAIMAVANNESGDPIGKFEIHGYSRSQDAWQLSLFHVLMKGAGLRARRELGLTEGQLAHPTNAAKLFLAFLCEKGDAASLFPLDEHWEDFAAYYNGKKWQTINPKYVDRLKANYAEALQAVAKS